MAAALAKRAGKDARSIALWQFAAHELATGRLWFSRSDADGRAFHNLASLPKELRLLLTIAGEPLAEVDIANAQPLFLLSLYPKDSAERRDFGLTVGRGGFYEALFLHLPRPLTSAQRSKWGSELADWGAAPELRQAFKRDAIAYALYSGREGTKGERIGCHPINRAFAYLFPELSAVLALRLASRGGASALAREMQRREAELILGRVFPRILAELPDCAPVSLHDAVLCQFRFGSAVSGIVGEETRAIYGVAPMVRLERACL